MSCENRTLNNTMFAEIQRLSPAQPPQHNGLTKPNVCKKRITATTRWFNKARCLQNKTTNHIATIYHDPMSAK